MDETEAVTADIVGIGVTATECRTREWKKKDRAKIEDIVLSSALNNNGRNFVVSWHR